MRKYINYVFGVRSAIDSRLFIFLNKKISKHQNQKRAYGLFVWFESLRPSQQIFCYVGTGLPSTLQV